MHGPSAARAGMLTAIILAFVGASVHLHDSHLKDSAFNQISGPLSHFAQLHGIWWEVGALLTIGLLVFFVFYQVYRHRVFAHNPDQG